MVAFGWFRILLSVAGLLGLSGVAVGALGAHAGGGDLARLASSFLLIHAVAVIGIAIAANIVGRWRWVLIISASCLGIGAASFSGELALHSLGGVLAFGWVAPVGGALLLLGWLLLAIAPMLPGQHVGNRNAGSD